MNFVFISPNFPDIFWQFCDRLSRNGVTVLAAAMGNQMYTAVCDTLEEAREFAVYVLNEQAEIVTPALFR